MTTHCAERRKILRALALAPLVAPLAAKLGLEEVAFARPLHSRIRIGALDEPGTQLIVSGVVYAKDGRTPLPNMRIDVYHTDAAGYYSRPVNDPRRARLRGSLVTDAAGRYEIVTIKPGKYFDRDAPAHIHTHLSGPDIPEHWIDSYLFTGDPYLPADSLAKNRGLGSFSAIMTIRTDSKGVLHTARDIRLDPELVDRNRLVGGWYR